MDLVVKVEEYTDQLELTAKQRKWFMIGAIFGILYMRGYRTSAELKKLMQKFAFPKPERSE